MLMEALALLGGGALNYMGATSAADTAAQQSERNMQQQMAWNKQQDPFSAGGNRQQYVPQLNQLMQGGYQGMQNDPMFKWRQDQALEATQRKMSAMGQGIGTNDMLALQNQAYGQQGQFFNEQYNRLADLSGANRGGGQAPQGMDPKFAGQMQMAKYQAGGETLGGLAGIYGSMSGSPQAGQNGIGGGTYTGGYGQEMSYGSSGQSYFGG